MPTTCHLKNVGVWVKSCSSIYCVILGKKHKLSVLVSPSEKWTYNNNYLKWLLSRFNELTFVKCLE